MASLKDRFKAAMVLGGVGDAIGYKNGKWEFLKNGVTIHNEYQKLGGLTAIDVAKWCVSDDTVMHIATAKALTSPFASFHELMTNMTKEYDKCMADMNGRAPGLKCISSLQMLEGKPQAWDKLPYDPRGGGCGGSMRAMAIGLAFYKDLPMVIKTGIESGRITHTHVNGFMGALVSALFTQFAITNVPIAQWGHLLMTDGLKRSKEYLEKEAKRDWEKIKLDMNKFELKFGQYLKERGLDTYPNNGAIFPAQYDILDREAFYKRWSFDGWAGSSGDDSVIIAYDALLASGNDWEKLVRHGVLHGGDNDSTGSIAACWYGAMYGMPDAKYENNWKNLEYRDKLETLADKLYTFAEKQQQKQ